MAVCPFADQSHRYDGRYAGAYVRGAKPRGVLHTTETTGRPGYKGGASAPHFTQLLVPPFTLWQHYDTARPSRALKHPAGTIDTNNLGARQIELVAYSDRALAKRYGGVDITNLNAQQIAVIARLLRWLEDVDGIDHHAAQMWKLYPSSAGVGNGIRFSTSAWKAFSGWCGHEHVTANDHGDPSRPAIAALLAAARPITKPKPTVQEDDMQLDDKVTNVWTPPAKPGAPVTFEAITVNEALRRASRGYWLQVEARDQLRTLIAANAAQTAAIKALSTSQGLDPRRVEQIIHDDITAALSDLRIVPAKEA